MGNAWHAHLETVMKPGLISSLPRRRHTTAQARYSKPNDSRGVSTSSVRATADTWEQTPSMSHHAVQPFSRGLSEFTVNRKNVEVARKRANIDRSCLQSPIPSILRPDVNYTHGHAFRGYTADRTDCDEDSKLKGRHSEAARKGTNISAVDKCFSRRTRRTSVQHEVKRGP